VVLWICATTVVFAIEAAQVVSSAVDLVFR
jgi:hypothetical protein